MSEAAPDETIDQGSLPDQVKRHCTDVPFLIFFVAALASFAWVIRYGVENGNPGKFLHLPTADVNGNFTQFCGWSPSVKTKPYVFLCPSAGLDYSKAICVADCAAPVQSCPLSPKAKPFAGMLCLPDFNDPSAKAQCTDTPNWTSKNGETCNQYVSQSWCTKTGGIGPNWNPAWNKFSDWAVNGTDATKACCGCGGGINLVELLAGMELQSIFGDEAASVVLKFEQLVKAWKPMLASAAAACAFGLLYLLFVAQFAGEILWGGFIVIIVASGGFGGYMLFVSKMIWEGADVPVLSQLAWLVPGAGPDGGLDGLPGTGDSLTDFLVGVVFVTIALIFSCILFCKKDSIDKAVDCVSSAADCVREVPDLTIEPFVAVVFKVVLIVGLLAGAICLLSCGDGVSIGMSGLQIHFSDDEQLYLYFYLLMSLWLLELVNAASTFVLAYITQLWYFKKSTTGAMFRGYYAAYVYHLGTLAFGSYLIATTRFVRIVVGAITAAAKEQNNQIVVMLGSVISCFVDCFERFLQKLNAYAYMEVAINSSSFCPASELALGVITSNATAVMVMSGATFMLSIAGAGGITAVGALATYFMTTRIEEFSDSTKATYVEDPVFLTVVSAVICFMMSIPFMLVFSTVADTILFCFAVERKRKPAIATPSAGSSRRLYCLCASADTGGGAQSGPAQPEKTAALLKKVAK